MTCPLVHFAAHITCHIQSLPVSSHCRRSCWPWGQAEDTGRSGRHNCCSTHSPTPPCTSPRAWPTQTCTCCCYSMVLGWGCNKPITYQLYTNPGEEIFTNFASVQGKTQGVGLGEWMHLSDPISVNKYHDKVTYKNSQSPFKNVFILKSQHCT